MRKTFSKTAKRKSKKKKRQRLVLNIGKRQIIFEKILSISRIDPEEVVIEIDPKSKLKV